MGDTAAELLISGASTIHLTAAIPAISVALRLPNHHLDLCRNGHSISPMAWSARRIVTTVLLTVLGLAVAGGIAVLIILANIGDPLGPRECECELFKEWTANLPLTPAGNSLEAHEVSVAELVNGFRIGGSGLEGVVINRDAIFDALTDSGLNHRVDYDEPDRWIASFFPGATQFGDEWDVSVTAIESGVGIQIGVTVDGSPWGLETIEDVWDSYQYDREAALAAQEERQRQAIEILEPVRAALETIVGDPSA